MSSGSARRLRASLVQAPLQLLQLLPLHLDAREESTTRRLPTVGVGRRLRRLLSLELLTVPRGSAVRSLDGRWRCHCVDPTPRRVQSGLIWWHLFRLDGLLRCLDNDAAKVAQSLATLCVRRLILLLLVVM